MPRLRPTVTLVALLLATAGCTTGQQPRRPDGPAPEATMGLTQLIPLEGTRHALLRVTNTGDAAMAVTSVAVEWPGYPDGTPASAAATIGPGDTLDLRLDLPDPACAPVGDVAAVGVVGTEQGTVRGRLQATGTTYLRRLWRTQCQTELIDRAVEISYSPHWVVVGEGVDARAVGDLVLRRRDGDDPIEVLAVDGSVLHGLRLPGGTTLAPGEQVARIPLEITPGNRCDEHARGQATAPFDFLMHLRIGDAAGIAHPVEVPLPAMTAAGRALDIACLARE